MAIELAKDEERLPKGTLVSLVGQKPWPFQIESSEIAQQLRFYRLKGVEGGLFLRSSLRVV